MNKQELSDDKITGEDIQVWRNERQQKIADEINAILEKYNCILQPVPIILPDGRISAELRIIIKD